MNSKLMMPLFLVLCLLIILALKLAALFVLLALLPSVVVWYIDNTAYKHMFKTILSCNLAGLLPPLATIMEASKSEQFDLLSIIKDPYIWLIVYTAAAVGWGLVFLCRYIARFFVTLSYEYRIVTLERMQRKLVEEWGQRVKEPASNS